MTRLMTRFGFRPKRVIFLSSCVSHELPSSEEFPFLGVVLSLADRLGTDRRSKLPDPFE